MQKKKDIKLRQGKGATSEQGLFANFARELNPALPKNE